MSFSLQFTERAVDEFGETRSFGTIDFNGEVTHFASSLGVWDEERYQQQWVNAIHCLLSSPGGQALICTDLYGDSPDDSVLSGWAVYRRENDVIAQEVVILEGITTGLTFDEVQTLTPPYEEDADISEWHATVHDIQGWLAAHS